MHQKLWILSNAEMAEWPKAPVLKTGDVKASAGSNPALSARTKRDIDPERKQEWHDIGHAALVFFRGGMLIFE